MKGDAEGHRRASEALDEISPHIASRTTSYEPLVPPVHAIGWRRVRWGAYAVYFAVLAWIIVTDGVPTGRTDLAIIIISGLVLTSIGRSWRATAQVIMDWLPFTGVLLLYDQTRGVADRLGIPLHESDILRWEKASFGGVEPTVWLQHHLYHPPHVYWYDAIFTLVYITHFLATPVLAAILWLRDRAVWLRYITRVIALSLAGLVTYILFPEAPPWYAARDGLTDPIHRLSARGWIWLHAGNLNHLLANAQNEGSNPIAAMPSLHAAFALLVALTIAAQLRTRWRYLLFLYPAAMGLTLVYTGEHYVLDLVAGWVYALAIHAAVTRWEARRARRRESAPMPHSAAEIDQPTGAALP